MRFHRMPYKYPSIFSFNIYSQNIIHTIYSIPLFLTSLHRYNKYKMKNATFVIAILVAQVFVMNNVHAQRCNADQEIQDCYTALIQRRSPSPTCCNELKAHRDCLCKYNDINNPTLPPNHQFLPTISGACGIHFPLCPNQ